MSKPIESPSIKKKLTKVKFSAKNSINMFPNSNLCGDESHHPPHEAVGVTGDGAQLHVVVLGDVGWSDIPEFTGFRSRKFGFGSRKDKKYLPKTKGKSCINFLGEFLHCID